MKVALNTAMMAPEVDTETLHVPSEEPARGAQPVTTSALKESRGDRSQIETFAPGANVKLDPLVLTPRQVSEYGLPRTPIKESDRRKAGFEAVHGEGAVELDALEALYPGQLSHIVEEAIVPRPGARGQGPRG
jgi:hypothetical protein